MATREASAERRAQRKARGVCVDCAGPLKGRRFLTCVDCRLRRALRQMERYQRGPEKFRLKTLFGRYADYLDSIAEAVSAEWQ